MTKINDKKNADQFNRREFLNESYALIYAHIMPFEARGFNSHARAQILSDELANKVEEWILKNKEHYK